jgi:tetratricopeptide (TPR) repeat protein
MNRKIIMMVISLLVFAVLLTFLNQIRRLNGQGITRNYDGEIENKKVGALRYLSEGKNIEAIALLEIILERYKDKEGEVWNKDKKRGVRYSLARVVALKALAYTQQAQSKMRWLKEFNLPHDDAIDLAHKAIKECEVILDKYSEFPPLCPLALYQIGYVSYYIFDERAEAEKIWRRLINTYPETFFSSMAKFCLGEISTEEFLKIANSSTSTKDPFLTSMAVVARMEKEGHLEQAKEYCRKTMGAAGNQQKLSYIWAARELKRLEKGDK